MTAQIPASTGTMAASLKRISTMKKKPPQQAGQQQALRRY